MVIYSFSKYGKRAARPRQDKPLVVFGTNAFPYMKCMNSRIEGKRALYMVNGRRLGAGVCESIPWWCRQPVLQLMEFSKDPKGNKAVRFPFLLRLVMLNTDVSAQVLAYLRYALRYLPYVSIEHQIGGIEAEEI
jgi:uncharacterized membrane protein YwzB